jgi:hypothetical protein
MQSCSNFQIRLSGIPEVDLRPTKNSAAHYRNLRTHRSFT